LDGPQISNNLAHKVKGQGHKYPILFDLYTVAHKTSPFYFSQGSVETFFG